MKRIYLLTLLVAGALSAFAQRNPNLTVRQLWAKAPSTTYAVLKDGDRMVWDGGEDEATPGKVKYNMGWRIVNHGATAMDTVQAADTVRILAPWQPSLHFRGSITGGLGQHDSTGLYPQSNPLTFVPNEQATSGQGTSNWCDSIWITAGPSSTNLPLTETDMSDNKRCSQLVIDRWQVGIENVVIEGSGILIFPNPTTGKLNFSYDFGAATDAKVTIVNMIGAVVYQKELKAISGMQDVPVEANHLSEGMYILQVSSRGITASERFSIR